MPPTFRESLEDILLSLTHIKPLSTNDITTINSYKDGTFGTSYAGYLMYCTGKNPRGLSNNYPYGLLYNDGENIFGIGVFRKEKETTGGHIMIIAPRGKTPLTAIKVLSKTIQTKIPNLKGIYLYLRFLTLAQYKKAIHMGFLPPQELPWHNEAFAEDETYSNALILLPQLFRHNPKTPIELKNALTQKSNRQAISRFENFLCQENINFEWKKYNPSEAKLIVKQHFEMLKMSNKQIGSSLEDYINLLNTPYPERFATIGTLTKNKTEIPICVFIGEKISHNQFAIYCAISRRGNDILQTLNVQKQSTGFSALSTYALLSIFAKIQNDFPEVTEINIGGSETADLNAFKRRLGAINFPSYWAVKKIS